MKAWLLEDYTGVENLRLADVPDPVAQPGEIVLEVRSAGLNPADRYLSIRQYPAKPPLPHILGRDAFGTVVQVGSGVTSVRVGDRRAILRGAVGVNRWGTLAQFVAVPEKDLVETPAAWTEQEAAGATLVYLTAYQALTMWGPLHESIRTSGVSSPSPCEAAAEGRGEGGFCHGFRAGSLGSRDALHAAPVVLVTGASGGVGVASVQLAVALGCTVIALSRNPEKGRRLREMGAAAVFQPEDPKWRQEAKALLAPRGVDLAIDNIGGKLLPQVIDTLGDYGKVSLVGRLAGPVPEFNTATLFFKRLRLGGVAVGTYTNAESHAAWQEVLRLLARTSARPIVDAAFPFDQAKQAFARLAQGPMGKVLLRVT